MATVAAVLVTSAAAVGAPAPAPTKVPTLKMKAYVPDALLSAVQQNPRASYDVIVQGDPNGRASLFFKKAFQESAARGQSIQPRQVKRQFLAINGGRATLTGWQILALGMTGSVKSITANDDVQKASENLQVANSGKQLWAAKVPVNWTARSLSTQAPTIAIVDSGIDANRSDFAGRVLGRANLASLGPNSEGDGYGHGTFVAGIAAGAAAGHAGVAPSANLIDVDIMNDAGAATVADVVAGADWILQHKAEYNIKVANFSLHAAGPASIAFDPIDKAVEKLWLNGVVVVAASGNYRTADGPSGVPFAPGNDPFVITVGAADIKNTIPSADDVAAPFSAYGYTRDGFRKPELSAPGRYMIGPMPANATLAAQRPDHVVAPGYMQLSGTSFSAPAVAGTAALLLAKNPTWTPDQVKGALMVSATATPAAAAGSLGVGELDNAAALKVVTPPNPNAALDQFLTTDASGAPLFDASAWKTAATSSAAWADAAWSDAAWADAAWSDAAWSDAAWSDAAWSDAAWSDAAWADAASADAASGSSAIDASLASPITGAEAHAVLVELGLLDASPVPPLAPPTLP
jgi:serine protease AprX